MEPRKEGEMMKYGFSAGKVVRSVNPTMTRATSYIKLAHGGIVRAHSLYNLLPGDEVVASWCTKDGTPRQFKHQRFVEGDAVERILRWQRTSRYIRRFPKSPDKVGYQAENLLVKELLRSGIRAAPASDFEDEVLGLDLWVFLKHFGSWAWYPIDLTVNENPKSYGELTKCEKALNQGVLPIWLDWHKLRDQSPVVVSEFLGAVRDALDYLLVSHKPITRTEAVWLELERFAPAMYMRAS